MQLPTRRILHVLGGKVLPVDQIADTNTEWRLEAALKLWQRDIYQTIIVSGSKCHPPDVQQTATATLMQRWLIEQNVPEDSILALTEARDTYEEVEHAVNELKQRHWLGRERTETACITVVSQWQHTLRAQVTYYLGYGVLIHRHGLDYPLTQQETLEECVGLAYHLIDWRGTGPYVKKLRQGRTF